MNNDNLSQGDPLAQIESVLAHNRLVMEAHHCLLAALTAATEPVDGDAPGTVMQVARQYVAGVQRLYGVTPDWFLQESSLMVLPLKVQQLVALVESMLPALRQIRAELRLNIPPRSVPTGGEA